MLGAMARALTILTLAFAAFSCVAEGGEVGDYCREDRDCREALVCLANACRAPAFDGG